MATQPSELYEFSTDTGLTMPDTDDTREKVVDRFVAVFGANIDTSEETHIGRFIDEITETVVETTGVNAQNANQFNLNYATGIFLDNLGAAFGVARVTAAPTSVDVTLTCDRTGITIPAGTLFSTEDGYDFSLDEDVEIPIVEGDTATVHYAYGRASATENGRIYCPANTLTTVKSSVLGLVSVNNSSEGTIGRELETDAHYRNRIKLSREGGSASCGAILNALYALTTENGESVVSDAIALENGHAYPVVKQGIVIPPHGIYVCLTGDDATGATEKRIAEAIYRTKTAGADYTTSTVSTALHKKIRNVIVTDSATGVSSTVTFFRPVMRGLKVKIKLNTTNYTGTDAQDVVKDAVKAYLTAEGIGAEITAETLVTAIAAVVASTIVVSDLKLEYDSVEVDSVSLSAGEAFTTIESAQANPRLEFQWL